MEEDVSDPGSMRLVFSTDDITAGVLLPSSLVHTLSPPPSQPRHQLHSTTLTAILTTTALATAAFPELPVLKRHHTVVVRPGSNRLSGFGARFLVPGLVGCSCHVFIVGCSTPRPRWR